MPDIVRLEITGPKLNEKENAVEQRAETTARIVSMLSVNFSDENEMDLAMMEFRTFLREWKLTKDEVLEAYRMAVKKQLQKPTFDYTGKQNGVVTISVFPNLSIIQAAEILNAYQEYKISSPEHTAGIKKLKELMGNENKAPELKPEDVDREKFFEVVFEDLTTTGKCVVAFTLFEELEASGKITISNEVKKRLFQMQFEKHKRGMIQEITSRSAKSKKAAEVDIMMMFGKDDLKNVIKRKCRAIVVCNYLKKHLADYETFKKAINGTLER